MGEYLAPGVFVEEIDSGSKPIEGVGVNMAAFVGYAKSGRFDEPIFISNWGDFCREFGEDDDVIVPKLCDELGLPAWHVLQEKRDSRQTLIEFANERLAQNYRRKSEAAGGKELPDVPKNFGDFVKNHNLQVKDSPYLEDAYLAYSVRGFYDNGGGRAYIVRVAREQDFEVYKYEPKSLGTTASSPATFALGGISFKALTPGKQGNETKVEVANAAEEGNGFTMTVTNGSKTERFGSARDPLTPENFSAKVAAQQSKLIEVEVQTAFAERPAPTTFNLAGGTAASAPLLEKVPLQEEIEKVKPEQFEGDEHKRTGVRGLSLLDDLQMICVPDLMAGLYSRLTLDPNDPSKVGPEKLNRELLAERKKTIMAIQKTIIDYCELKGNRMCILDPIPDLDAKDMKEYVNEAKFSSDHGQGTIYYPWVKVIDQNFRGKGGEKFQKFVPPCGHTAGVWCRTSIERGVHKAPANETLMGVVGLQKEVTKGEQEILNPVGINCFRSFPGTGIRVWGARTLATVGNPSWKYVNVRRLFNYLKDSLDRGLQWVVFEPNDHDLWGRVRRNISAFLFVNWKEGMLFGQTPEEAFYVKCDAETNPKEMIDQGRLYVEIGVNPVKPAEFVIIRMGQWSGGGESGEF